MSRILASPFGAAIEAIRENETRARACGFDVERTKLLAFILSGLFCGLAGTLSALHLAIVPLDTLSVTTSGTAVIMTLLGGIGTFFAGAYTHLDVYKRQRKHILRAAARQFVEGDVQHWWLPHTCLLYTSRCV